MKLKPVLGHYQPAVESRTHQAWRAMIARCHNPSNGSYHNYGGRGIAVCERWRADFLAFLNDMGEPGANLSIDRVDNDGDYEPGNCRWATRKEQGNNRRTCRHIDYQGKRLTIMQASEASGLSHAVILQRLKAGWPEDKVFEPVRTYTPPSRSARYFVADEEMTCNEMSARFRLPYNLICKRIRRGVRGDALIAPSARPYRFRPS
jgi:hypothetical protein